MDSGAEKRFPRRGKLYLDRSSNPNANSKHKSPKNDMPLIDPVTMSSGTAQPAVKASSALPIVLLPTELARSVTLAHPAVLLAVYYFRFGALVADPIPTLLTSLLPLAAIQILYTVACLPATGSNAKVVKKGKAPAAAAAASRKGDVPTRILTSIFALLISLLSIPAIFTVQVLFGAPVTSHIPHTLLSSAHVALLAVFPLVYVHGYDSRKWWEVLSVCSPVDEVFGATVGCLVGAWLGAVPIPLDWDREWQRWPVTVVTGAYLGYVVGKAAGARVFYGMRIEFE